MARYLVTSGSKFEPYSYDELIKPLSQATEAHMQTQSAYDEMAANAGSIGALIGDGPGNENAHKIYDGYMSSLDNYIDDLSKNGYGVAAQRGLSQMRQMYGKQITGIANAIERRRKVNEELQTAARNDPSLIIQNDPNLTGLDRWLENPEYAGPTSLSGAYLQKMASDAAENFKKVLTSEANTRNWKPILGGQYFESATFTGATPQQIEAAKYAFLNGATTDDAVVNGLADIMRKVYVDSGIDSWGDDASKMKAVNYIQNGINSALGTASFETLANKGWGLSGGSGSSKGSANAVPTYPGYGPLVMDRTSRRQAKIYDSDLKLLQGIQQRIQSGEIKESDVENMVSANRKELKDRADAIRLILQEDLGRLHKPPFGPIEMAEMRDRSLEKYPEYRASNEELRELLETTDALVKRNYKDMLKDYGVASGNLDDVINAARERKSMMAAQEKVLWNKQLEQQNISQMVGTFLDGVEGNARQVASALNKDVAILGHDGITKKDVKKGDMLAAAKAAINSKDSRYAVDAVNGRVLVNHNGVTFSFSPDLFYAFAAPVDKDYMNFIIANRMDAQGNPMDTASYEDFYNAFKIGDKSKRTLSAPEVIRGLKEWTSKHYANDPFGVSNFIQNHLWEGIQNDANSFIQRQTPSGDIED